MKQATKHSQKCLMKANWVARGYEKVKAIHENTGKGPTKSIEPQC